MQLRLKPLAAALILLGVSAQAAALDIGAGELNAALRSLANEMHTEILFDADDTKGVGTSGAHDAATTEDALRQILQGTGLGYQVTGKNTYVVKPTPVKESTLDEIVVAATRTKELLDKVPASVSVVTRKDFEARQAATVADAMKFLPNVDFGGGPRADGQIPTIRGYQGASIILLVDGARRNAPPGLSTPLYIEPSFLSRAEVVKGSASSLYGAGGVGGAMSFTTLSAGDLLAAGRNLGGDVKVGYGSGDLSHHYLARLYGKSESGRVDGLLGLSYRDFNDIRQGGGTTLQFNSGHGDSELLKLGLQASEKLRFEFSHQVYKKQSLQPNNPQIVTAAQTQLFHVNQSETVLKAETLDDGGEKALDAKIYSNSMQVQNDANVALNMAYASNKTDTVGGSVQNTTRLAGGMHRLTYGLDTYRDKLSNISGTAPSAFNPDGKTQVTGVFLQDEISFGPVWRIIPSARYDKFAAAATYVAVPAANFSHFSPKLALAWQTTERLGLYGSYGQAYRAPTVGEMYVDTRVGGAFPTTNFFNFAGNPSLRPETDTTFELGANYGKEQVFSTKDSLKLRATVFQSKAKDMINANAVYGTYLRTGFGARILGPNGQIFQAQNVSSASRDGIELEGNYALGAWQGGASYSRLRVKDDATGNNLFAPPDKLAVKVGYAIPETDVSVTWNGTAVAAQDYDFTIARRRSGYTVHDLYLSWAPIGRKFKMDFGIGNLSDKKYMTYQSGNALAATAYEMGRNYKLTLSGSF